MRLPGDVYAYSQELWGMEGGLRLEWGNHGLPIWLQYYTSICSANREASCRDNFACTKDGTGYAVGCSRLSIATLPLTKMLDMPIAQEGVAGLGSNTPVCTSTSSGRVASIAIPPLLERLSTCTDHTSGISTAYQHIMAISTPYGNKLHS